MALVIGNGSYQYTPALANRPNDAKDVAQALKAIGFDVTLKVDVEKRRMDQVIAEFAREGNGRTPCSSITPATACSSKARTS